MSSLNPSPVSSSTTVPHGGNASSPTTVKQAGGDGEAAPMTPKVVGGEGEADLMTPKVSGGKKGRKSRKSRKMPGAAKDWVKFVVEVFNKNRAKNPSYKYKQAMKDAAKMRKKNKTAKK
jgi:hypothetical protein